MSKSIPKILSVVGARPNFMKVAPIHRVFQTMHDRFIHQIVHTGQHYDAQMSDAFFNDLEMPHPAYFLGVGSASHAEQTARVMLGFEQVCIEAQPDYVIVVGDVNSTVACALTSVKMGIRTAHVEAGLRSGDRDMPEEINRIVTDAIASDLFVTEQSGVNHLIREGASANSIHLVGNTMIDSLLYALPKADLSTVQADLGLLGNSYILVTLHRPSNVDNSEQLRMLAGVLTELSQMMTVVFPVHPRTRVRLQNSGITFPNTVILCDPMGYVNFLALMKNAAVVLTDSGGIQEETTALGVPCVTARTSTERPSTTEIGTNLLVVPEHDAILKGVQDSVAHSRKTGAVPPLWDGKASERIVATIASFFNS